MNLLDHTHREDTNHCLRCIDSAIAALKAEIITCEQASLQANKLFKQGKIRSPSAIQNDQLAYIQSLKRVQSQLVNTKLELQGIRLNFAAKAKHFDLLNDKEICANE